MEYAPGLKIDWSEKEWEKIQEIKARPNRLNTEVKTTPWDENKIKYYKKIDAICLLRECDVSIIKIAELFNLSQRQIMTILQRN